MADYNLNPPLLQLCRNEAIRRRILSQLSTSDLCSLRLTSCAFSNMVTSTLFSKIRLTFSPSALSRQCRIEALGRIGHHIRHFTFSMHHSDGTFLPPLLNPKTGQEIGFMYTPHTSLESEKERPKYGTSELGRYLTAQYPAIFHAATNVPAFIRAISCMVNMEHISISCPDQEPVERYRRSAVDYALISLRIAIERAPLPHLSKLSLACHPAALLYLHPTPNFGASPSAMRRWRQIRNLKMSIDSWPFENAPTDHMKLLSNYLRVFAGSVEKCTFHWYGIRGPCPLTAGVPTSRPSSPNSNFGNGNGTPTSPNSTSTSTSQKLFAEITSPMSPLPLPPPTSPLHFEKLRRVQVRNTHVTAMQISSFITRHASSIKGMDFDNVVLTAGTWDEALLPLGRLSSKEAVWEARHSGSFMGGDGEVLSRGEEVCTPTDREGEGEENSYTWRPKEVVEERKGLRLRESFVEAHMAATPSHLSIAKKHRRRRRRHTSPPPPPPPPSFRHQASHLLGKLKKEASQSSFFGMFRHHDSTTSSSNGSVHSIKEGEVEVEDEHIFLATPRHNRAMPSVPTNQEDYFDLGTHDFSQPAYEPTLESLLQQTTYSAPLTPPRTPTKQRYFGTPRSQIWELDRPSSLASISEAPFLEASTYSPASVAEQQRHPLDRRARVEDAPLTPPDSPQQIQLLSPSVYTPPSASKTARGKNISPCYQQQRQHQHRNRHQTQERVRGQPIPRPPMVKLPALALTLTPMLEAVKTPITPWPCGEGGRSRSLTPLPLALKVDTNISHGRQLPWMVEGVQGNQRDLAREGRYVELANNVEERDEVLRCAREKVMGRLGRKYSGRNPSTTSLITSPSTSDVASVAIGRGNRGIGQGTVREEGRDARVCGGEVQQAVRREMWSGMGCGNEFSEVREVRESVAGHEGRDRGRVRSVLVPFMILR